MIVLARKLRTVSLALAALAAGGCGDEECSEPRPTGAGDEGEPCVTIADCLEGLACLGTSFEQEARCADPAELPGGADPGCLDHAGDWESHEADVVSPITTDDEGCEILVFESACNCIDLGDGGECTPAFPRYRLERWRSCGGCCWRLVAFWNEPALCAE